MTFRETPSSVTIANRALGMVSESRTIATIDDTGHIAAAVRRWYKPIVARLLEMHHWGLATVRAPMVATTNNRSDEWLAAYSAPDDMAFPVGITLLNGTSSVSYYRGLSGLIAMAHGRAIFQYQSGVIYTNLEGDLEYVSFDITEADFTATFENIVVTMLASRLALELPKDKELSDKLAAEAQTEINMAITQNLNMGNRKYGAVTSEAEVIRGIGGESWDYFPRSAGQ